jgi:plastocyanin
MTVASAILGLMLIGIRGEIASAGETARASATATVRIVNFAFKPATLKVAKGSRVSFSNTSSTAHTATRGGSFDTGRIRPGKSVPVRFAQKGSFAYHCKIHPSMRGKIVVD